MKVIFPLLATIIVTIQNVVHCVLVFAILACVIDRIRLGVESYRKKHKLAAHNEYMRKIARN